MNFDDLKTEKSKQLISENELQFEQYVQQASILEKPKQNPKVKRIQLDFKPNLDQQQSSPKNRLQIINTQQQRSPLRNNLVNQDPRSQVVVQTYMQNLKKKFNLAEHMTAIENRIKEGQIKLAGIQIQNAIKSTGEINGKKSPEYIEDVKLIIKKSCQLAIQQITSANSSFCLEILFKCNDILTQGEYGFFPECVSLLYNNFGVAYKRSGEFSKSLTYFEKAIIYMKKYNLRSEQGITYLNLSALLSQMGKHEQALEYALDALHNCHEEVQTAVIQNLDRENIIQFREKINYYAISHYNLGQEYDHLRKYDQSLNYYKQAFEVYEQYSLEEFFSKSYFKFKDLYLKIKEKNGNEIQRNMKRPLGSASIEDSVLYQPQIPYYNAVHTIQRTGEMTNKILHEDSQQSFQEKYGKTVDFKDAINLQNIQKIQAKFGTRSKSPRAHNFVPQIKSSKTSDQSFQSLKMQDKSLQQISNIENIDQNKNKLIKTINFKAHQRSMSPKLTDKQIDKLETFYYRNKPNIASQQPITIQKIKQLQIQKERSPLSKKLSEQIKQTNHLQYNANKYQNSDSSFDFNDESFQKDSKGSLPQMNNYFFQQAQNQGKMQFAHHESEGGDESSDDYNKKRKKSKGKKPPNYKKKFENNIRPVFKKNELSMKQSKLNNKKNNDSFLSDIPLPGAKKKQVLDSSFFAMDESSYMPKDKDDLEIMGKLSWSSDNVDSQEEGVYKDTRLNFLVENNHYLNKNDVKFDENKRMKEEFQKQLEDKEYQLQKKLKDMEEQIQQVEIERRRKEELEKEVEIIEKCKAIMKKVLEHQKAKMLTRLFRENVVKSKQRKEIQRQERVKVYIRNKKAKFIQKQFKQFHKDKKEKEEKLKNFRNFFTTYSNAKKIQYLLLNKIKKKREIFQKKQEEVLFKIISWPHYALIIQRYFRMWYAQRKQAVQKLKKIQRQKILLKRKFVRLKPTKYASELYGEYYALLFQKVVNTNSLNFLLIRMEDNKQWETFIDLSYILEYFSLKPDANGYFADYRYYKCHQLFIQDYEDFVIREEDDLVLDRYGKKVLDEQIKKQIDQNTKTLLGIVGKKDNQEDTDDEADANENTRRIKQQIKLALKLPMVGPKMQYHRKICVIQAYIKSYLVKRRLEVFRDDESKQLVKRKIILYEQAGMSAYILIRLIKTHPKNDKDDYIIWGNDYSSNKKRFEQCSFPNQLIYEIKRIQFSPSTEFVQRDENYSQVWLKYLYIDIENCIFDLSDLAEEKLHQLQQEQFSSTLKNIEVKAQENIKQIIFIQSVWRSIIVREEVYYNCQKENYVHFMKDYDPFPIVAMNKNKDEKQQRRNTSLKKRQSLLDVGSSSFLKPPPVFLLSRSKNLVAKSFHIIEEMNLYILLIYVDDVFTRICITAIKQDRKQQDKLERLDLSQRLKTFVNMYMLKFYTSIMVQRVKLSKRQSKINIIAPNIEEIISEYQGKITSLNQATGQSSKHISAVRKKEFRKTLRKQFTFNEISSIQVIPEKIYEFIENKEIKAKIDKYALKVREKKKAIKQSDDEGGLSNQEGDQNKIQTQLDQLSDSENENLMFGIELEDKRDRQRLDIKKISNSVREIARSYRRHLMKKRLKLRQKNRGRGLLQDEEEDSRREREYTNGAMRYAQRYLLAHNNIIFSHMEIFIHVIDKSFIIYSRHLLTDKIIQKMAFPFVKMGLGDKFLKLEYENQMKYVRNLINTHVQKKNNKIAIVFYSKAEEEKLKRSIIDDQYKKRLKQMDDIQNDKFVILIQQWKEKLETFKLKVMFNWYYHIVQRQIILICLGNSEKFLRVNLSIDIDQYNSELGQKIFSIFGGQIKQEQGGPTNQQVLKLKMFFSGHMKYIRKFLNQKITKKNLTFELMKQVFQEEKRRKAIRKIQFTLRRIYKLKKLQFLGLNKMKKQFFLKKLLFRTKNFFFAGHAYLDRSIPEPLIHIKGRKLPRSKEGVVEVFEMLIDLNETLKVFYNYKNEESLKQVLIGDISQIQKNLKYFCDKEFKKFVEKKIIQQNQKQFSSKAQRMLDKSMSVSSIQRFMRRKQTAKLAAIAKQRKEKLKIQFETLGILFLRTIIRYQELFYFVRVYHKIDELKFYAQNYLHKNQTAYGVFNPSKVIMPHFIVHSYNSAIMNEQPTRFREQIAQYLLDRIVIYNKNLIKFDVNKSQEEVVKELTESRKIHTTQRQLDASILKFDVIYHSKKIFRQEKISELDEENPNVVKIDVNVQHMEGIKQYAVQEESVQQAMKYASEKIATGMKITKMGSFILDMSNTDQKNIQIHEKRITNYKDYKSEKYKYNVKDLKHYTKILAKAMKMDDSNEKYLVQIKQIETPMKSIQNIASDIVFENCEIVIQIEAIHYKYGDKIVWELEPTQFNLLTQKTHLQEGAIYLLTKLHLIGVEEQEIQEKQKINTNNSFFNKIDQNNEQNQEENKETQNSMNVSIATKTQTNRPQKKTTIIVTKENMKSRAVRNQKLREEQERLNLPPIIFVKMIILIGEKTNIMQFKNRPDHIILLTEKKLILLQRKMRECRFQINYKKSKKYLKDIKNSTLIGKNVGIIDDEEYIICVVLRLEQDTKEYLIIAWKLNNYKKIETSMGWQDILEKLVPNQVLVSQICENLFFYTEGGEQSMILNAGFIEPMINEYREQKDEMLNIKQIN